MSKYNIKRSPVVIITHALFVPHAAKQQCSAINTTKNTNEIAKLLTVWCASLKDNPIPHSRQMQVDINPEIAKALSIWSSASDNV
ncbi:hypothetical protein [Hallella sp.]|uniref:hypothetical protein n=1 Tax=Hallella sp. TaxID=2980186 RepID=UPI003079340F